MTGYTNEEIIGRNCTSLSCSPPSTRTEFDVRSSPGRFLQTPGGGTMQGQPRKYTDGNAAVRFFSYSSFRRSRLTQTVAQWHMRQHIQSGKESQSSLINYTKEGRPFINLVTMFVSCRLFSVRARTDSPNFAHRLPLPRFFRIAHPPFSLTTNSLHHLAYASRDSTSSSTASPSAGTPKKSPTLSVSRSTLSTNPMLSSTACRPVSTSSTTPSPVSVT